VALALYGWTRYLEFGWDGVPLIPLGSGVVTVVLMYPLCVRFSLNYRLRKWASGLKGVVGEVRLILTESALTEITSVTRSEARWADMDRIEEHGDYTFIYVTPGIAGILPRHGFLSEEEYEHTKALAKEYLNRAKG
jgi:hypothetical protein